VSDGTVNRTVPAVRCFCPARHVRGEKEAREYAQEAARAFKVGYPVRTLRLVAPFPAHVGQ
jgi:hypothetical protein